MKFCQKILLLIYIVTIDSHGKIVVAGKNNSGSNSYFSVVRYK
ncbi:MAG TPA: hypothetical protein PLE45_03935 [Spirochaetota bacterium]|nr:hypothetical protein [Spirochaetota bacterium]